MGDAKRSGSKTSCVRVLILICLTIYSASASAQSCLLWREAEQFDDNFGEFGPLSMPSASAGWVLDPRFTTEARHWASYRILIDRPVRDGVLLLRYASDAADKVEVLIEIDGLLPTEQPALLLGPTGGSGHRPQDYRCAVAHLGPLPVGIRAIRFLPFAQDRAAPQVPEQSRETPKSLEQPTTGGAEVSAGGILVDGFFVAEAPVVAPTDLWSFNELRHRAMGSIENGSTEALRGASGYVIEPVDPWLEISRPLERPIRASAGEVVWRLEGSVNEHLSGSLLLCRIDAAQSVEVRLESGETLGDRLTLRIVGLFNSRWYGPVFDPLFNREEILAAGDLSAAVSNWESLRDWPRLHFARRQTHMVWATCQTQGLAVGAHHASLRLVPESESAGSALSIPIEVHVKPIILPCDNPLLSYAFTPCPESATEIEDRIAHGINVFRSNPYPNGGRDVPESHRRAMALGAKFILYNYNEAWGLKPIAGLEQEKRIQTCVRDLVASARNLELGRDQWAAQMSDEPNARQVDTLRTYARLAREVAPDIRLWINPAWSGNQPGSLPASHGLKTFYEPLNESVDVWCPFVAHLWRTDEPTYDYLLSTGKELWFYKNASIWSKQPDAGFGWYRKVSWIAFKYRTRAAGLWHLAYFMGDPWDDFDQRYPDAAFTYRGQGEHLIGSRVYEAYRQGVQEYKRLWWLDTLLREAARSSDSQIRDRAPDVRKQLETWVDDGIRANSAASLSATVRGIDAAIIQWQQLLGSQGQNWSSTRWARP